MLKSVKRHLGNMQIRTLVSYNSLCWLLGKYCHSLNKHFVLETVPHYVVQDHLEYTILSQSPKCWQTGTHCCTQVCILTDFVAYFLPHFKIAIIMRSRPYFILRIITFSQLFLQQAKWVDIYILKNSIDGCSNYSRFKT